VLTPSIIWLALNKPHMRLTIALVAKKKCGLSWLAFVTHDKGRLMDNEKLTDAYIAEGWGVLAQQAGFDPVSTETAARSAFRHCWDEIVEREAELIYLRMYGKEGAVWSANESKEVWRAKAASKLIALHISN
jgi:hypothetical protein